MDNISEYDKRQLKLMYECLASFQKKQIQLSSLISSLEFLLNAMESVDEEWEYKFLKEITTLETINAVEIIEESEKEKLKYSKNKNIELVNKSVINLKTLIQGKLPI
ncbi:MAG: hypothetical protein ACFFG0_56380 [Candidatus Thorarchaeota archaeon]